MATSDIKKGPLYVDGTNNRVGIGTASPSHPLTVNGQIKSTGTNGETVQLQTSSQYTGVSFVGSDGVRDAIIDYDHTGGVMGLKAHTSGHYITFATGGYTERMRIDSSGHIGIGTTTLTGSGTPDETNDGTGTRLLSIGFLGIGRDSGICGQFNRNNDGAILGFRRGGTEVGTISVGSSSTSYNTSSDYRLKENVTADWDATTRLKQLNPVRFNFIVDADTTVDGFLAHEVQDVVPEAITGTKDAVDEDGNPEYQGIDQSKVVPLLTKALIEAVEKIEQLETRLAALEAN